MVIKKVAFLALVAMVAVMFAGSAHALDFDGEWLGEKPENMPDISIETAFLTKYIWRGQNLGNDPVIQSGITVGKYGLSVNIWGNVDTSFEDGLTELDYTLDYSFNVGEMLENIDAGSWGVLDPLSISTGYIYYTFPNLDWTTDGWDSHELYISVSYDIILQPYFSWYWDVDTGNGSYYEFGGSHSFDFDNGISAGLGLSFGYNDGQWGFNRSWTNTLLSGDVSIPFFNYFTVTPSVAYSISLDDQYESEFYGGFTIGFDY